MRVREGFVFGETDAGADPELLALLRRYRVDPGSRITVWVCDRCNVVEGVFASPEYRHEWGKKEPDD